MNHITEYLPAEGNFSVLEFDRAREITAEGVSSRILGFLGLESERYEILTDENELSDLRSEWLNYVYGDKVFVRLTLALKDGLTGDVSASRIVRFSLYKIHVPFYADPDDFDPGIDAELYSEILSKALSERGDTVRLRRAFEKGMAEGALSVAYIGGSITEGASSDGDDCFARISANWLERYVAPNVSYDNAGISGSDSTLGCARLGRDVLSYDPDIIFIEYAANDDPYSAITHESFESMVRTALARDNDPAVVIIISYGGSQNLQFMTDVAAHYGLPVVNVSDGISYAIENGAFTDEFFRPDGTHPDSYGHQIMSDMIEELFRSVAAEIGTDPDAPVSAIPSDAFLGKRFEGMTMVEAQDLDVISAGCFRFTGKDFGWNFTRAATSNPKSGSDPLVFRVTGKTVELVIKKDSWFEVTVDGGSPVILGSGSYFADAVVVVLSDDVLTHTISVKPAVEGLESTLIAVAYN